MAEKFWIEAWNQKTHATLGLFFYEDFESMNKAYKEFPQYEENSRKTVVYTMNSGIPSKAGFLNANKIKKRAN